MLGQGQECLGIAQQQLGVSQRQAAIGEANAMIGAKREVATEQHQKETESRQMKQDLRTQMTANQSQINQLRRSLTSYEVQADSKAQADILNEIKRTRSNYDNLLKEYKLVDRDENISDDAVSIAVQIQDYAQGIGDRPPWLKQIYSTAPSPGGIGGAAGGTIAGNPETASPEAKAIAEYAVNLGVPDNLIDLTRIEQNLATKPIEWLIQAYMEIAKNAKPVKSGTAKTEKSIGNK
jgi:archaellum component FlaC